MEPDGPYTARQIFQVNETYTWLREQLLAVRQ